MTSLTANTASDVCLGAAGRLLNVMQPHPFTDRRPLARYSGGKPTPAAFRYEQFRTDDPVTARRFFAGAYTPGWRINGLTGSSVVNHRRWEADSIMVDEVLIQGQVGCEITTADSVVVIQPRTGSLTVAGENYRLRVGQCSSRATCPAPCRCRMRGSKS